MTEVRLIGKLMQILGIGVMFIGFVLLVLNIQTTVGSVASSIGAGSGALPDKANCDSEKDGTCGIDVTKEGGVSLIFEKQVHAFLIFIGAGIVLLFIGLILQASEEICGFLGGRSQKSKQKEKEGVAGPKIGGL